MNRRRLLSGPECMAAQGFGVKYQKLSLGYGSSPEEMLWAPWQMRDLAGNAFNGYALAALLTAGLPLMQFSDEPSLPSGTTTSSSPTPGGTAANAEPAPVAYKASLSHPALLLGAFIKPTAQGVSR